jgi:ArsR family transcriptional regulator
MVDTPDDSVMDIHEIGAMESVATELHKQTEAVPRALQELAADLRVIADHTRMQILHLLSSGERCVCEIAEAVGTSQPLASHHLSVLRRAGLIRGRRDARWIYYSINAERLQEINGQYGKLFDLESSSAALHQDKERCP